MTREEQIRNAANEHFAHGWYGSVMDAFVEGIQWADQHPKNKIAEQLTAFAQHLNKRGAFRDDLCMDFEHEAQSFIEFQNYKEQSMKGE